jgi:hypothetical protein
MNRRGLCWPAVENNRRIAKTDHLFAFFSMPHQTGQKIDQFVGMTAKTFAGTG